MTSLKEHKARGLRHVKNTKKYKDKTKVPSSSSSTVTVRPKVELESNWDRYKPLDEDAGVDYAITDFNILANAPASVGSHFKFKSDKLVASTLQRENFQDNELFKLDLHLLNASLNTIPFPERYGFERGIFSENELGIMDADANAAKKIYEELLKNKELGKSGDVNEGCSSSAINDAVDKDVGIEDDLDLLLKITSPVQQDSETTSDLNARHQTLQFKSTVPKDKVVVEKSSGGDVKKEDDLEQWLDNILDD